MSLLKAKKEMDKVIKSMQMHLELEECDADAGCEMMNEQNNCRIENCIYSCFVYEDYFKINNTLESLLKIKDELNKGDK